MICGSHLDHIFFGNVVSGKKKKSGQLQGLLFIVHPIVVCLMCTITMLLTQLVIAPNPKIFLCKSLPSYFSFIWAGLLLIGFHPDFQLNYLTRLNHLEV